ncbi:hypothetical protein EMIT0373P_40288 [Pseudomonas chlororaphis]
MTDESALEVLRTYRSLRQRLQRVKPLDSCGRPGKRWVRLAGPAQPAQ